MLKNNLMLLILCCLMTVGIYVFIEKPSVALKKTASEVLYPDFNLNNFQQIKVGEVDLLKEDKKFKVQDFLVSTIWVKTFNTIFQHLQLVKKIEASVEGMSCENINGTVQKLYFNEFKAQVILSKDWCFTVGDINYHSGEFYLFEKKNNNSRLTLVKTAHPFNEIYSNEVNKLLQQYYSVLKVVRPSFEILTQNSLISYLSAILQTSSRAIIKDKFKRTLELDFTANKTTPSSFNSLPYQDLRKKLELHLSNVFLIPLLDEEILPKQSESEIRFVGSDQSCTIELLVTKTGHYVKICSYPDQIFKLYTTNPKQLNAVRALFFTEPIDYWDKRVFTMKEITPRENIEFNLSYQKKNYQYSIPSLAEFEIVNSETGRTISNEKLNLLFNMILSTSVFPEANLVATQKDKSFRSYLDFKLDIFSDVLSFSFGQKAIWVYSKNKQVYFIFEMDRSAHNILKFQDFIEG